MNSSLVVNVLDELWYVIENIAALEELFEYREISLKGNVELFREIGFFEKLVKRRLRLSAVPMESGISERSMTK